MSVSLRAKLVLLCGVPILGLIISLCAAFYSNSVTAEGVARARDESAVLAATAADMQLQVVQVQQWLTDISATRGQDGLADGFDKAAEASAAFLAGLERFDAALRARGDAAGLQRLATLREAFDAYYTNGRLMAEAYIRDGTTAGNVRMGEFDTASEHLRESLDPLVKEHTAALGETLNNVADLSAMTVWLMAVAGALLVLLTLVSAWRISVSITRPVQSVVTALTGSAGQVASAAKQLSESAQLLTRDASKEAASIEETSAALEELSSMTKQNAANADKVAQLMNDVDRQVVQSNEALAAMVEAMRAIGESSESVARIIRTIDEIAFQTNILALNAAVEAARAGAAGMGFAVVADEVRELARRSAEAAQTTTALIEQSRVNAERGGQMVSRVTGAVGGITGGVAHVKSLVEEVRVASGQQSQGVTQIADALTQLEQVSQGTAAASEESAAASEQLTAEAASTADAVQVLARIVRGGRPADEVNSHGSPASGPAAGDHWRGAKAA